VTAWAVPDAKTMVALATKGTTNKAEIRLNIDRTLVDDALIGLTFVHFMTASRVVV
jgi:hypothetical protein